MLIGIPDPSVAAAYILLILAVLLCTVYGIVNWNREGEISEKELLDEKKWSQEEIEIEQDLAGGS